MVWAAEWNEIRFACAVRGSGCLIAVGVEGTAIDEEGERERGRGVRR